MSGNGRALDSGGELLALEESVQPQLRERLGADLFERVKALRKEQAAHPHREAALAFSHGG